MAHNKYSTAVRQKKLLNFLHEWESVRFSQKPHKMMLFFILIFNILLVLLSAWVISAFAIHGNKNINFFAAVYNTFTMILDAGCIESVISDPSSTNIFLVIFCLVIIVICMITFTGALIGYATNLVSNLIENANANSIRLRISNHIAVLGWNTRAAEIINDLLYCKEKQKVVVLADGDREEIMTEISERLEDTIEFENEALARSTREMPAIRRLLYMHNNKLRNRLDVIVREGDVFSASHLNNIQLEKAKSIIILGKDLRSSTQTDISAEEEAEKGDNRTIKTLIQVVDIACKSSSSNNQKIVVEVENEWTGDLVDNIIQAKQQLDRCRVVPFQVHTIMGQLLSQFSIMPELNKVYSSLFSNKSTSFFARVNTGKEKKLDNIETYLNSHRHAIPLLAIRDDVTKEDFFYYMANDERDIDIASEPVTEKCELKLNPDFWLNERYILILGSNSKISNIMDSYSSFISEWTSEKHPNSIHITIVDEEEKLKKEDYYQAYPFVEECVSARIIEKDKISEIIKQFIYQHNQNSSILILSDDTEPDDDVDAKMMAFLIYAKNVISKARKNKRDESFNIDIIAEVMDPRHVDLVRSYDVDNVVISNRYISKMVTQISENYARYNLYADIMNYDEMKTGVYDGIEIYIKKAGDYFNKLPPKNTSVEVLVRSVFEESRGFWGSERDYAMMLGYIDVRGNLILFGGDRDQQRVTITAEDKLVLFSNH